MTRRIGWRAVSRAAVLISLILLAAPPAFALTSPDGLVHGRLAAGPQSTGITAQVLSVTAEVLSVTVDMQSLDGPEGISTGATQSTVTVSADVLFAFDQATLTKAATAKLRDVAEELRSGRATGQVLVGGHADNKGHAAYNLTLSQRRAQAVVAALQPLISGLPVTLVPHGYGDTRPVARNTLPNGKDNPAGRKLNRRVTITFNHP